MRVTRILSKDQEFVTRFLAVLGRGLVIASRSKTARPGFFIYASSFMREYLEPEYFKKEEVLLQALEDCGFPADSGPVGGMRSDHRRSQQLSTTLAEASKAWQAGDEGGRAESIYTTSEYTDLMRHHFEQWNRLISPLLEQTITPEGELKVAEDLNRLEFAVHDETAPRSFTKIVDMLDEEAKDWES